jgi:hypothetical protein
MSRRRWAIRLAPPVARVAGVTVVLAGVLSGCAGARPGVSPEASAAPGSMAPAGSGSMQASLEARGLLGRTWIAEGPRGWEAGQIGGRRITLGQTELGLAAGDRWILSAVLSPIRSIKLLVRDGPAGDPREVNIGSLSPTATVIVGDRAYVSGLSFAGPDDPGILEIDLRTGTARSMLRGSGAPGGRYLAASPDGSTLVTSLCDLATDPAPEMCSLTVISLAGGAATSLGDIPGGLLRGTSADVAVVAPQDPEPPAWLAGIDLRTGTELWRLEGGEFGPSVMTDRHGLIQQRIRIEGPKPRLVVEAIDLPTGRSQLVYEETRGAPGALWPALCSETSIAVGEDATGSRAIAAGENAQTRVRLVPLAGGDPVDVEVSLRSEP